MISMIFSKAKEVFSQEEKKPSKFMLHNVVLSGWKYFEKSYCFWLLNKQLNHN